MSTRTEATGSRDAKAMARRLRDELADRGVEVSHSEALELDAHQHGARDWNTFTADTSDPAGSDFGPVIPVPVSYTHLTLPTN